MPPPLEHAESAAAAQAASAEAAVARAETGAARAEAEAARAEAATARAEAETARLEKELAQAEAEAARSEAEVARSEAAAARAEAATTRAEEQELSHAGSQTISLPPPPPPTPPLPGGGDDADGAVAKAAEAAAATAMQGELVTMQAAELAALRVAAEGDSATLAKLRSTIGKLEPLAKRSEKRKVSRWVGTVPAAVGVREPARREHGKRAQEGETMAKRAWEMGAREHASMRACEPTDQ